MERGEDVLPDHIAAVLKRLERDPSCVTYTRVLAGGLSGSGVYALRLDGADLVLKSTLPESDAGVVARARREALFYQHLAARVPLRTPTVLAMASDESGVALLFPAYLPPLTVAEWSEEVSMVVVSQLARLHAQQWDDVAILSRFDWLRNRRAVALANRRSDAQRYWEKLEHDDKRTGAFHASRVRAIHAGLERAEELAALIRQVPVTLCHGDCHRENILHTTDGQLVWTDWQEVSLGRGLTDLIFFAERAYADGAQLPYDDMLQVYRDELAEAGGPRIPHNTLQRAAPSAELLSWLLDWPPFLMHASPERLTRVLERIQVLISKIGDLG